MLSESIKRFTTSRQPLACHSMKPMPYRLAYVPRPQRFSEKQVIQTRGSSGRDPIHSSDRSNSFFVPSTHPSEPGVASQYPVRWPTRECGGTCRQTYAGRRILCASRQPAGRTTLLKPEGSRKCQSPEG